MIQCTHYTRFNTHLLLIKQKPKHLTQALSRSRNPTKENNEYILCKMKKLSSCNMPKQIFVGGNGLCCHKLPLNCGSIHHPRAVTHHCSLSDSASPKP